MKKKMNFSLKKRLVKLFQVVCPVVLPVLLGANNRPPSFIINDIQWAPELDHPPSVTITHIQGNCNQVLLQGYESYGGMTIQNHCNDISSGLEKSQSDRFGQVIPTKGVNVRDKPNGMVIDSLKYSEIIEIIGVEEQWLMIRYHQKIGFVHKKFVKY